MARRPAILANESSMRMSAQIPETVTQTWPAQAVDHAAGSTFSAHYHEQDEWLRVEEGRMAFTNTGTGARLVVTAGSVLEIPAGTVHHVRVDEAVHYQMWTSPPTERPFRRPLDGLGAQALSEEDLAKLVFVSFEMPRLENRIDEGDEDARRTLLAALHPDLQFRRGSGKMATRRDFEPNPPATPAGAPAPKPTMTRWRSTDFVVLHATAGNAVVSIDVHTVDHATTPETQRRTRNLRTYVLEADRWQCRLWVNYPVA
jgi:hypothetical protein